MRKVIYILILSTIALMGISIKNYSNKDVETGSLQSSYEDYEDLIIKYGNKNEKIVALTFDVACLCITGDVSSLVSVCSDVYALG